MNDPRAMQHGHFAFVNHSLLAEDKEKPLRLRSLSPAPPQEGWRGARYKAADILEHLGWCRSTLERGRRHCALGAILAAYNQGDVEYQGAAASDLLREAGVKWMVGKVTSQLAHLTDLSERGLMGWNDNVAKDGNEV